MTRPTTNRATGAIATAGAFLLIAASAALGTYFGFQTGSHVHWIIGLVFAAAALGGELLKPFATAGAFDAFGRWQIGRGIACVMVAFVCIVYSLAGELALSAASRGDLVAERARQAEAAAADKGQRARAEAELKGLKAARPVDEIEPLLARAQRRSGGCGAENGTGRWICPRSPAATALAAELGRARRRADLEAIIAKPVDVASGAAVGHADPLASSVAHYMTAAGRDVKAADLSIWLYLIPVLFIEIGSAFGIVVARAASGTVAAPARVAGQLPATVSSPATVSGKLLAFPGPRPRAASIGDGRHVLDALKASPRPMNNGELAAAMGVTPGEASKRRALVAHLLEQQRDGRELRIRLAT